jgi:soluble lytic murein transglycosylase
MTRGVVIGGTLVALAVAGVVAAKTGVFRETLLEVTLPLRHEDIIRQQASDKSVPADLIAAVIYAESRFRDQESNAGARGLMQVTPETAELIEGLSGGSTFETDDLSNPDINIRYGTFYLRYLLDKFDQNTIAALAAYNAGETNVAEWGGSALRPDDIRFPETRDYVNDVIEKREEYRRNYAEELGLD